jgi:hypothetical protein
VANIVVGSDFTPQIGGVRNAATGDYLNSATVTFVLYNAVGTSVTSGSCTYVTSSDAVYRGVIESTVTSTLTAGNAYYLIYTVSSSGIDSEHREDLTAVAPGSVIIDAPSWCASTSQSISSGSADELALQHWCEAVVAALLRKLRPYLPFPRTITAYLDAPHDNVLILPFRPVRSITSISLHWGANGDPSAFVADDALDEFDDWYLPIDPIDGINRTGEVYRRNSSIWSVEYRRPLGRLAVVADPNRGALKVVANVGEPFVPADIRAAAVTAVTLLMNRRKTGGALQSESFGGYSYSSAGPVTAEAAINSPEVLGLLRPYLSVCVG